MHKPVIHGTGHWSTRIFRKISEANILSTFEQLHQNKDEVFERGVMNLFRGLSCNLQTNCPVKFGNKIIVNNLVRWDRWGLHLSPGNRQIDLPTRKNAASVQRQTDPRQQGKHNYSSGRSHPVSSGKKECYEDEMFIIKYFKKGSAHITFRKPELVDRLNEYHRKTLS
ncbi:DUF4942 domain-containing protein [Escherichia coli]|uniref:DUF4942 domain-containing protein n=1 Tax=Escherichia coli TaxID=562 RepID=UPI0039A46060